MPTPVFLARDFQAPMGAQSGDYGTYFHGRCQIHENSKNYVLQEYVTGFAKRDHILQNLHFLYARL